jgi:hypothetical protein
LFCFWSILYVLPSYVLLDLSCSPAGFQIIGS